MIIDPIKKELILAFMHEAKNKNGLNRGFNQNYNLAIGLVDVSISFEAFINELMPSEPDIHKKRDNFSTRYQTFFEQSKGVFLDWITSLKKELDDNGPLQDMTPRSGRPDLTIANLDNLSQIIEVVYRVRSNLVHGSKDLVQRRNKVLIENSFRFIYHLLELIFEKEKIN